MPPSKYPPVRMEWEKPYLEALVDQITPSGTVLEVGFALGYAANRIESYHPQHHTIIESDPDTAARARAWAKGKPHVSIIENTWMHALPQLGVFDAILFNAIDPSQAATLAKHHVVGAQLVQQGKELIAKVKEQIPHLSSIRYSNADLEDFFNQADTSKTKELGIFLTELKNNGQISNEQYEHFAQQYHLKNKEPSLPDPITQLDPMFPFLKACLHHHMRKGSRFSCFSIAPNSYYEDPVFFDAVITNPDFTYQEHMIPVQVPASCPYYKYQEALVMLVEKMR